MAMRYRMAIAAALLAVLVPALCCRAAAPVKLVVEDTAGGDVRACPLTLAQVFPKGAVTHGVALSAGGRQVPAQVDVKRRYDDGSVRFALVSPAADALPTGSRAELLLQDGKTEPPTGKPVTPADLLKTTFDAVVTFHFADGTERSASARKLLAAAPKPAAWLEGPAVSEWLLSGPPVGADGTVDPDLNVQFQVRAYAGMRALRVSVVVENCWDTWAGNIRYDVAVSIAGKPAFEKKDVDHGRLSRWRKVFWWGREAPALSVKHDVSALIASGALPNYDRTITPSPRVLRDITQSWERSRKEILENGILMLYMPTTGGRLEIGPYPCWAACYLLTMDPALAEVVLTSGDLAGSWPIHVRARQSGRILTLDERPQFWLDARGRDRPEWKADRTPRKPDALKFDPDVAHHPSVAYLPYLLTGDYYYLEEEYFWASYCLLAQWPVPRKDGMGILSDQIRGNAWALRDLGDAAWIAPDGAPEGAYFAKMVGNNLAAMTQAMYGPPEMNQTGAWGPRTVEDARIPNPANPRWIITVPWEQDYLTWAVHHLTELGFADAARPRDFLMRLRVGMLTHAPDFDPNLAAPYRFVAGEFGPDKKPVFYDDWKKIGEDNAKLTKPGLPADGGSYSYSARAVCACGVDAGFPKADEALRRLDEHLPEPRKQMANWPTWAIAPRGK